MLARADTGLNNTKWREVWTIVAAEKLRVQISFVSDDHWNSANAASVFGPFSLHLVEQDHIRDPGIGGPFFYREIRSLRILGTSDEIILRLRSLGQLPLSVGSNFVELEGYC